MGYDPFLPIAPALINVLCVPAGKFGNTEFTKYLEWLRINVGSVLSSQSVAKDELGNGQPSETSEAGVGFPFLFHYSQHDDGDLVQNDHFFEPNRHAQVVLGLLNGSNLPPDDSDALLAILQDAKLKLERFASQLATTRPLTRLIIFDHSKPVDVNYALFLQSTEGNSSSPEAKLWLDVVARSALGSILDFLESEDVVLPTLAARFDRLNGAETRRDPKAEDARRQSVTSTSSRGTTSAQVPNSISEDGIPPPNSGMIVATAILHLQRGSWKQSLDGFARGARVARDAGQHAWHAKALEGILVCMILLAWSGHLFQIPQDCYPISRGFASSSAVHNLAEANRAISEKFAGGSTNHLQALTAMLPGLLATIMNLYEKAATGYTDTFPKFFVCEARVRLTALLVIVKKHDSSFNVHTLAELTEFRRSSTQTRRLETPSIPLVLRGSFLGQLLVESIMEAQVHLPVQSASTIYLAVCKNLSQLKLERKQGFFLKDVLQRLPPVFMEARRAGSAGVIVPTAASDRQQERVSQSVRALLDMTARAYELPVGSGTSSGATVEDIRAYARQRLSSWFNIFASGDIATKLEVLRLCIRVADALPDPVGSIKFMSLLLHIARQAVTLNLRSSNAVPLISAEEQKKLVSGIQNSIASIQRINSTKISADYWDDFLVRGITLYEHPSAGKLMPHTSRDLSLTSSTGIGKKDPFIYNPFAGSGSTTGPSVLVEGEIASFDVILQNPLEVELEVETIRLVTEGCDFDANIHNVVLAPLCVQVFTLKGTPKGTGTLKITGCEARLKNCHERRFVIFSGHWKPTVFAKEKNALLTDNVELPTSKILELTIVDPLPSLSIIEIGFAPKAIMLLDGETFDFSFDLENTSDLEADLVLFSYEDSASRQLRDALATKDLQPADMYELQHQLTTRPAIRRILTQEGTKLGRSTSVVPAYSRKNFSFSILGKPGLTEATVLIDYAYIGKPRGEVEGTFHTRQLRYTVNVTVNGSVDIPRCSILSIPPTGRLPILEGRLSSRNGETDDNTFKPPPETCLLQLDLRSIWQTPLRVTIDTDLSALTHSKSQNLTIPGTSWSLSTTLTLLPTQITRTLIPIPKIYIQNPTAPIPSLSQSNRQFVISASKLSLEADLAARESFWYREKLVSLLRVRWEEEHGTRKRSGEIDVRRGIRVSGRMIDALRVEHVQITFDLKHVRSEDNKSVKQIDHNKDLDNADFKLPRNSFANLSVKVSNFTPEPLKLILRLQPSLHNQPHTAAMDLTKKFIFSGVLQQVCKSPILPGETVEVESLGVVGLVEGMYEVNATVEEVRARSGKKAGEKRAPGGNGSGSGNGNGNGGDEAAVEMSEKGERKIWHARRPCLIRVVAGGDKDRSENGGTEDVGKD